MKKIIIAGLMVLGLVFEVKAESFQPNPIEQKAFEKDNLPPQLKGWDEWVLDDHKKSSCNFAFNNKDEKFCYYISSLDLDVSGKTLNFSQKAVVLEDGYMLIPGSFEVFPVEVAVDGKVVPVMNRLGLPYVFLEKGEYVISGKAKSKEDIRYFSVPIEAAILSLKKDGVKVLNPAVDAGGVLRLESNKVSKKETDDVSITAFRKITDAIPMNMVLRIDLNVSGSQRVENFGDIVPDNFAVLSVKSSIPAYVQKNGDLVAEVQPGNWWIEVSYRQLKESLDLVLDKSPSDQEIWVFVKDQNRRVIQVPTTVAQIQTKTTNLPNDWKSYPGYEVKKGDKIKLEIIEYTDKKEDALTLNRNIKLSYDGKFYSVKDSINANFERDGRLSMPSPFVLSSVEVNGEAQAIIALDNNEPGFEVRKGQTNIMTTARIGSDTGKIKAAGYNRNFSKVNWNFMLSPGYKLLHVSGADYVSSSWVANWNLLSIFIVVLLGVIFYYLFGWKKALIAEAAFVLLNPVFPQFTLMAFVLCGVLGVERYLSKNEKIKNLVKFFKYSLLALLSLAMIGFAIETIRFAMYPGIVDSYYGNPLKGIASIGFLIGFYIISAGAYLFVKIVTKQGRPLGVKVFMVIGLGLAAMVLSSVVTFVAYEGRYMLRSALNIGRSAVYETMAEPEMAYYAADEAMMDGKMMLKSAAPRQMMRNQLNINSKDVKMEKYQSINIARNRIQTGLGFPEWGGQGISVDLNGPVMDADNFNIYLLSPFVNFIIALLQVVLGALLIYFMTDWKFAMDVILPSKKKVSKGTMALLFAMMFALPAKASDVPTDKMLEDLKAKMTREVTPSCLPDCASIPQVSLDGNDSEVVLEVLINAQEDVVLPLPAVRSDGSGFIKVVQVLIDDKPVAMAVSDDDIIKVLAKKGVSRIKIIAKADAALERFSIASEIKISLFKNKSGAFDVVENNGTVQTFQIKLKDKKKAENSQMATSSLSKMEIAPFYEVRRQLDIGTIWQVTTVVKKVNQNNESSSIEVPLLSGEKVLSSEGALLKDSIRISFAPGESEKTFESLLPVEQKISLKAPSSLEVYHEVWELNVDLAWSFKIRGFSPISNNDGVTTFMPGAGQRVDVEVFRAKSFDGEVMTIDSVNYTLKPGRSKMDASIALKLRSSEGGVHSVFLPKGFEVKSLKVDSKNYPVSQKDDALNIPVNNGETGIVFEGELNEKMGTILKFPRFNLNAPAVNVNLNIQTPATRWVLFATGPVKGPAVLFWSQVPVWILLAFALSRFKACPLNALQWFILLLGLSQSRMIFSVIVVVWFLVIGIKERFLSEFKPKWLLQAGALVLTALFVYCLLRGVSNGLLGNWDMKILGNGSSEYAGGWMLKWYQDATAGILPMPWIISLPLWAYKGLMVLWSAWLSFSFVKWMKWAFRSF